MKETFLLLILLNLFGFSAFSQNQRNIDSLNNELKKYEATKKNLGSKASAMMDTTKVKLLYAIYNEYYRYDPEIEMEYLQKVLVLSEQIGFKKGIGNACGNIGRIYVSASKFTEAEKYLLKAIKVRGEIGDKVGMARSYTWLGTMYDYQGKYPEAIKYNLIALKIRTEIGDREGMASSYNNLGIIYEILENDEEALKNFNAFLKLSEEFGDKQGMSSAYNLIGSHYRIKANYPEALKNLNIALKIAKEIGDKDGMGNALGNIGIVYYFQKNYPEAIKYYIEALKIMEELGEKDDIAGSYINIGSLYHKQGNLKEALSYTTKGLELAREIGRIEWVKNAYMDLSMIDSAMHNFKDAYLNYKFYSRVKDSMFNIEKDNKITALQLTYEFDRKQDSIKAEQRNKDALANKELQKQKLVRNGFIGGFAVVLLFAGSFFRQRNKIKKAKGRSDELLLNILPEEVAEELKQKGSTEAKLYNNVTVLFTDFVNFTGISEQMSPTELVREIHRNFIAFDAIIEKNGLEKIKTIGDAYLAVCGLPNESAKHAHKVVSAALEIQQYISQNNSKFQIRIGINSGPVVAGIVGVKKFAYDIWGDTVNTANRMESNSEAGKINISGPTYELVKNDFKCISRGKISAKNKGDIDMYFVEGKL